ncbi:MAG: response regulator transcription factor [Propionibacteriaceae bacterium]|jgi:two-component system alkaline phosphatase synthesis response regulator PhoP|nr:response regulator transcription factor [Propionibacteriaceae bacterium]
MAPGSSDQSPLIFVVEDDANIRDLVSYALTASGFTARGFPDGVGFREALRQETPDLILLDIMLPGQDGIALLERLKESKKTASIPVVMLTAKSGEYDRIKGLDLGADDYITKPFSVMEVIARVRAVLRRAAPAPTPEVDVIVVGGIVLDPGRRTVTAGGEAVSLTFREFELLECLMRNAGLALSRSRILDEVWGYQHAGETRTVDMHIKALRSKLGAAGEAIVTVRNVGYKIEG